MSLSESDIVKIVRQHIPGEQQARCLIHWDTQQKKAGLMVRVGRKEEPMPFDGYYVFVDLMPKANWGHPAFSLLISSDGNKTQLFPTEFPPHLDDYPETYRELMLE